MKELLLIQDFSEINLNKWDSFVRNHPDGNIFQTSNFFKVHQQTKNHYPLVIAVLDNNKDIVGIQVSVTIKLYDGILGKLTSRSVIFGGPLILGDDKEILKFILDKYSERSKKDAIFSQFRNMRNWGDLNSIFDDLHIRYEDHLDIVFDLTKGKEQLWKEMKRVRRKGINQSYKKGITIKKIDLTNDELLEEAYLIINSVYQRINIPGPSIEFIKNVFIYLHDEVISLGLYVENKLIAVRIALCYNDLVYDWVAGARDEYLNYRPNDVLPWELMKWGINNNYKIFDFGGAGKPTVPYGVRDFKLKFGGDLVNYGRFEIIHKPILMKIAKKGLELKQKISN